MPNIKSVMKNDIKSKALNAKNKAEKSAMKTVLKKFDAAVVSGDKEPTPRSRLPSSPLTVPPARV